MDADLVSDTRTGSIRYTSATNRGPDRGPMQGRRSRQDFNAVRPPP